MGSFSIWHWLILLVVVLLLFGGAGKIPRLMSDMAKGVRAFKSGLKDEEEAKNEAAATVPPQVSAQPADAQVRKDASKV
ncbi:MAG TPA: twin-arginine translocase TatA/TatE family subunit [Alphaproteobacteria bacterium]|nr:twin-arginine translocase TatA/TatE family subunit [Alphaproteobacteria bacterium]